MRCGRTQRAGGRPRVPLEVREAARAHTAAAIETLVEVMKDRKAPPSARVSAAEAVLNRGWGRQGVDALLDRNKETKDFGRRPMRSVDALLNIRDARTALQLAPRDEWAHWTMAGAYMETG